MGLDSLKQRDASAIAPQPRVAAGLSVEGDPVRITTIVTVVALSVGVLACDRAQTPLSPTSGSGLQPSQTAVAAPTYFFAKVPAQIATYNISPGVNVEAFRFTLDTTGSKGDALAEVAFMIFGSVQAGNLSNFRLVYYPKGVTKPGTIIASNDGSTFIPGSQPANFLRLRPQGFVLPQNFKGVFALVVDVNAGLSPYFFWTRFQTANAVMDGVEQLLVNPIEQELPLQGDTFNVN
jgi:hypothetical protein